ncbi:unnamed protein product [Thlaspi arvense]|uniref:Netrin receptor DCC n=1 Tax=Thlaspi arvense TaxID=13288 RepID=A0AAU9RJ64_THLAR|nr:unnamed protein product [Thlaspi arvense]
MMSSQCIATPLPSLLPPPECAFQFPLLRRLRDCDLLDIDSGDFVRFVYCLCSFLTMPTSSAAALDRSLMPGDSKSHEIPSTKAFHSISNADNGESNQSKEEAFTRPHLYATPKEVPLPYSPSSSPPSPYIINHKARGPGGLLKSSSEVDVEATTTSLRKSSSLSLLIGEAVAEGHTKGVPERPVWDCSPPRGRLLNEKSASHTSNGGTGSNNADNGVEWESYLLESVRIRANKEFYNKGQSVSFTANTELEDDAGAQNSQKLSSSGGEFYDAFDELSSDSGTPSSVNNIEREARGMRLSLLMETERRRQAEETVEQMQVHWRRLREQLAHVGLFVPLDPTSSQYSINIADELRCQLHIARFVSNSLGNDLAKAEVEMEMESHLEAKNFEITRLSDRLHYYETVNQEMSQRNQEAIEMARRDGQKRKRRQRWIWGSIAATIMLGGAVLAWPYLPTAISSSDAAQPTAVGDEAKLQAL